MTPTRRVATIRLFVAIALLSACTVSRYTSAEDLIVTPVAPAAKQDAEANERPAASSPKPDAKAYDKREKPATEKKAPVPAPAAGERAAQPAQEKQKDNKKKDVVRRVVRPQPVANAVLQNNLKAQIRRQFIPMLKAELSFTFRSTDLNADERKALIEASKKWFDTYVTDASKNADPQQQQMWLQAGQVFQVGGRVTAPNPRNDIRAAMQKLAADSLPKEKLAAFTNEFKRREDFYRDATIDNMITCLDDRVILSPQQRTDIADALTKHWQEIAKPQLEAFQFGGSMSPAVPTSQILPFLTPAQKAMLEKLNTNSTTFFGGGFFGNQAGVLDDIDLGEPADEARPNARIDVYSQ